MEELMAQMESSGLSGSMYNRDDMASMASGMGYGDEGDEDMYGGDYGAGGMGDEDTMPEF